MEFNTFVNASIMFFGLFEFFGILGGIGFLFYFFSRLLPDRRRNIPDKERCETCSNYRVCVDLMAGCMPDYACAYWEKKKP